MSVIIPKISDFSFFSPLSVVSSSFSTSSSTLSFGKILNFKNAYFIITDPLFSLLLYENSRIQSAGISKSNIITATTANIIYKAVICRPPFVIVQCFLCFPQQYFHHSRRFQAAVPAMFQG